MNETIENNPTLLGGQPEFAPGKIASEVKATVKADRALISKFQDDFEALIDACQPALMSEDMKVANFRNFLAYERHDIATQREALK